MVKEDGSIEKWRDGWGIRISAHLLETAGFSENEKIKIFADKTGIYLKKADTQFMNLQELFDACGYHDFYECKEIDSGPPVGKEVW